MEWAFQLALAMHASADLAICCLQSAASSNAQEAAVHTGKIIIKQISFLSLNSIHIYHMIPIKYASAYLAVCCLQSAARGNAQEAAVHTGKIVVNSVSY